MTTSKNNSALSKQDKVKYLAVYTLTINERPGRIVITEAPYVEFSGETFRVSRNVSKGGWGQFDTSYQMNLPSGDVVMGSVSQREGYGVTTASRRDIGFVSDGSGVPEIGNNTTTSIDKEKMLINVITAEPEEDWPAVLCAVLILVDPQEHWESLYKKQQTR